MKFSLTRVVQGYEVYHLEADTLDEAKDKVYQGHSEPTVIELETVDWIVD